MIIDEIRSAAPLMHLVSREMSFLAKHKASARRFVISNEVLTEMALLLKEYPNLFVDNFQFSLPPFPVTYVEFNIKHFLETLGARRSSELFGDSHEDFAVGYLIADGMWITVVEGSYTDEPIIAPIYYTQGGQPLQGAIKILSGEDFLPYMLGSTFSNDKLKMTHERASWFETNFTAWSSPEWMANLVRRGDTNGVETMATYLKQSIAGEIRNMLVMLLWLNQQHLYFAENVPATRRWYKKRNIAYMAHHVIHLAKGVTGKQIRKALTDRLPPRRHQVRAFFRHYRIEEKCQHQWDLYPDVDGRWHCSCCKGYRVRVNDFMRGDASRGYVTKEYTL